MFRKIIHVFEKHVLYFLLEILDRLMMNDQESECPIPIEMQTAKKARELAMEFMKNYIDLTLPGEQSEENSKK